MPGTTHLKTTKHILRCYFLVVFNIFFLFHFLEAQPKQPQNNGKATQLQNNTKKKNLIRTIVIDAGHGGHDPGTVNFKKKEKDITLSIALKAGELIERNFKDVRVVYTRKKDEFIDLKKRAQIANQERADLFISIHCNAIETNQENFYGTETYVQDPKVESYNLGVAKRENSAILLEYDYKANYDGFDPNAPETHIMLSMFQNAYLGQSISFAQAFELEAAAHAKRKSRGVRQAGFLVLKATTMPSVLIETGFLSNENEKDFLVSDEGQNKIAAAIARAFYNYKAHIEDEQPIVAGKQMNLQLNLGTNAVKKEQALVQNENSKQNTSPIAAPTTITFRIQLLASQNPVDTNVNNIFKDILGIQVVKEGNMYKYYSRDFDTPEAMLPEKEKIRKAGFKGAFTVAFENGVRIKLEDAQKKIDRTGK
ncbi:MAG TPA: N-acetylmuramoyl-L-alanine amidase [Saprospiraceae bacterium]|nr:N-acetylmuramoyl-L-alanine amidase [Saprospiraceae bacterium]